MKSHDQWLKALQTVYCVCALRVDIMGVFKCTYCLCVCGILSVLLVYRATSKFHHSGWDCLLLSLQTRPKYACANLYCCGFSQISVQTLPLFFFSFFFLRQWMWIVEVCAHVTASLLLAEHIECEWKKTVAIHHAYLCLFCCRSQACPSEKVQSWSLEKAQRK